MLDEEQVCAKRAEFINGFTGGGGRGGYRKGAQPLVLAKGVQEGVHFRMKSKFWIWYFAGNYETIFWG